MVVAAVSVALVAATGAVPAGVMALVPSWVRLADRPGLGPGSAPSPPIWVGAAVVAGGTRATVVGAGTARSCGILDAVRANAAPSEVA